MTFRKTPSGCSGWTQEAARAAVPSRTGRCAWDLRERSGVCERQSDPGLSVRTDPGPGDELTVGIWRPSRLENDVFGFGPVHQESRAATS